MSANTPFTTSVQDKSESVINEAFASILCTLLQEGTYQYPPRIARDVSDGMIYEGDVLSCNCDEYMTEGDHPLNLFVKFCSHKNDLALMNIHSCFDAKLEKENVYRFMETANQRDQSIAFMFEHEFRADCPRSHVRQVEKSVQYLANLLWLFNPITPVYVLHRCQGEIEVSLLSPMDGEWVLIDDESVEMIFDYNTWRF